LGARDNLRKIINISLHAAIPVIVLVLLNFYWIIGLPKMGFVADSYLFSRGLFGDGYMNMMESISLFHPFWTGSVQQTFVQQPIPLFFFLIPLMSFIGLWLNRKSKDIVFFGIISLIGVLLTKQSSQPFSELYKWLYTYFPGFNVFRESSKFYFIIALGYSVLISSLVSWLNRNWKYTNLQILGKTLITLFIAGIFLWNAKSVITGEIGSLFVPRQIPNDYAILKDYLVNQSDFSRTFWVPTTSRWSIYTNNHPKLGFVDMFLGDWRNFAIESGKYLNNTPGFEVMNDSVIKDLLTEASVKYVIIPLQDVASDDDFYVDYGDRGKYIKVIENLKYLKKIDIGMKEVLIYENLDFKPHIYLDESSTLTKSKIQYKFINSTEYKVSVSNLSKKEIVVFTDSYHPMWKVKIGNFDWYAPLGLNNYFLPDSYHEKTKYNLNTFVIDPDYVKNNLSKDFYSINKDGSINVDLTLYFSPQTYFNLGGIVSLTALILCLMYLMYSYLNSKNKKNHKSEK
jgi:hypothetical protein